MITTKVPDRLAVRLGEPERAAVATIARAITHPHRAAPTVSEAIRAAVLMAASTIPVTDAAR